MEGAVFYMPPSTHDRDDVETARSEKLVPEKNWLHYALCRLLVASALAMQVEYLRFKLWVYYSHPDELLLKPWLAVLALCDCAYLVAAWVASANHLSGSLDRYTNVSSRLVSWSSTISFVNTVLWATLLGALAFDWSLAAGTKWETRLLVTRLALHLVTMRIAWVALWIDVSGGVVMRSRQESQFWRMILEFVTKQKLLSKWHLACVIVSTGVVIVRGYHVVSDSSCEDVFRVLALSLFLVTVSAHMLVPVLLSTDSASLIGGVAAEEKKWSWTVISCEVLSWVNFLFWEAVLAFLISHPSNDALHLWCEA